MGFSSSLAGNLGASMPTGDFTKELNNLTRLNNKETLWFDFGTGTHLSDIGLLLPANGTEMSFLQQYKI